MGKETKNEFDKLAQVVEAGFQKAEKRTDEKIDNLARMVKDGFDGVDKRFEKIETEMKNGFKIIDDRFSQVNARLSYIERDIAEIRKHFVYRDEFEDLAGRVKYLETKLGIESGK